MCGMNERFFFIEYYAEEFVFVNDWYFIVINFLGEGHCAFSLESKNARIQF